MQKKEKSLTYRKMDQTLILLLLKKKQLVCCPPGFTDYIMKNTNSRD